MGNDPLILLLKAMVEEREIGHEIKDDGQVLLDAQDVFSAIRAHASNEIPGDLPREIPASTLIRLPADTLDYFEQQARRDDWHQRFVGSDIRMLIGEIRRLQAERPSEIPVVDEGRLENLMARAFQENKGHATIISQIIREMKETGYLREPKRESSGIPTITAAAMNLLRYMEVWCSTGKGELSLTHYIHRATKELREAFNGEPKREISSKAIPCALWAHAEDGAVLWWSFFGAGSPYCGTPHDEDFYEGYYTHFTRLLGLDAPNPTKIEVQEGKSGQE